MSNSKCDNLKLIFHPRSIAFAGITIADPRHWTRTFFNSTYDFGFKGRMYLVNPRGGKIRGFKVYHRLADVPGNVEYVVSTVPAKASPGLLEECAAKGVKAVHFCTSGFRETGEEEGIRLEAELVEASRRTGIRVLGPNCMGVYCPKSRVSFSTDFPRETGPVGFISQSGGNAMSLISRVAPRGVRFSKVVSYGNASDISESDLLECLAVDPDTRIIAVYIEGVKDGKRFSEVLRKAAAQKVVVLLKGGVTQEGARAAAGHTGALAGSEVTWDALCKQLGVIRVYSLDELADALVTLSFVSPPRGRRVALIGHGGGASVLITDEFGKRGLRVPPLPQQIKERIGNIIPPVGNILRNPIDYSQPTVEIEKMVAIVSTVLRWKEIDFLVVYFSPSQASASLRHQMIEVVDPMLAESRATQKPMAVVVEPSVVPDEAEKTYAIVRKCVSRGLAVYYSFASAAHAINLVLSLDRGKGPVLPHV